jgi:hypothetical protein
LRRNTRKTTGRAKLKQRVLGCVVKQQEMQRAGHARHAAAASKVAVAQLRFLMSAGAFIQDSKVKKMRG